MSFFAFRSRTTIAVEPFPPAFTPKRMEAAPFRCVHPALEVDMLAQPLLAGKRNPPAAPAAALYHTPGRGVEP
jgi:hypothetical protein